MRYRFPVALLLLSLAAPVFPAAAASDQPTIYTIAPGDTLWGLSKRFLNDPHYWPNLWAANGENGIGNPHFIYPGQKIRVYSDRIEIEQPKPQQAAPAAEAPPAAPAGTEVAPPPEEPVQAFSVTGSEGFLVEDGQPPAGAIIATAQNRKIVGTDDIVYTDLGRGNGANVGDRYSIYKKMGAVSHPVTNEIVGERVIPLGELQLSEVEEKVSKAIITKSYQEISPGSYLLPVQDKKVTVPLRAADRDLVGYIVESQTGNKVIAVRDLVFLDLGRAQGVQPGNLLYIVRDVTLDQRYTKSRVDKFPVEVVGALVVLKTGLNTSTAVIVKSVDTIYRGDRVEMKKSR